MKDRRLRFALSTLGAALLSIWISLHPVRLLLGKYPNAPGELIREVVLSETLPALAPAALLLSLGAWLFARRRAGWGWPICFAPPATLAMLFVL